MTNPKVLSAAALAMLLTGFGTAQAAGDAAAGKVKANTCLGCHASPSLTNAYPTYPVPKVAGQHATYIVAALTGYKNGGRSHKTMHANAVSLSDQDMADIAAFFEASGQK